MSKLNKIPEDLLTVKEAPNEMLERKWNTLYGIDSLKKLVSGYLLTCLDNNRIDTWCKTYFPEAKNLSELLRCELSFTGRVLLVGDSGTGKSQFAEGLAHPLAKATGRLYLIKVRLIRSKFIGESSRRIAQVFDYATEKAKEAPVLLFFDEFDSVAPNRANNIQMHEEIKAAVNTLLEEMENISPSDRVVLIGATNLFEQAVDYAADRRFDLVIHFRRPNYHQRLNLMTVFLQPVGMGPQTLSMLANRTRWFTQADIKKFIKHAWTRALIYNRRLTVADLLASLRYVEPTRGYRYHRFGVGRPRWSNEMLGGFSS